MFLPFMLNISVSKTNFASIGLNLNKLFISTTEQNWILFIEIWTFNLISKIFYTFVLKYKREILNFSTSWEVYKTTLSIKYLSK